MHERMAMIAQFVDEAGKDAAAKRQRLRLVVLLAEEFYRGVVQFLISTQSAEDVELASVHRVLERLRAAINWGLAQTPPLFVRSPFNRFGVRMNKKAETVRDRRVSRDEEKRLLDTALRVMNTARHMYVGEMLHDRIIGALELCCRRGEMLLIQNKRVNWDTCQIGIPGATAKDRENRRIPFNPRGRLAAILKRSAALGPDAFVFGTANGTYSQRSRRRGRRFGSWRTVWSPGAAGKAGSGTGSNCVGSTSAGTT